MAIIKVPVDVGICNRPSCGYKWFIRKKEPPVQCPRCKSPEWNGPVKKGKPGGKEHGKTGND